MSKNNTIHNVVLLTILFFSVSFLISSNFNSASATLGTIKGIVYNDTNGNLIQNAGENGVSNWTVKLTENGTINFNTITLANGSYSFSGLGVGTYSLTANLPALYSITQPLNNTYAITMGSTGDTFSRSFGIYKEPSNLLANFGDIVSKSSEGLAMDSNGFLYDPDFFGNAIKKFYKNGTLAMIIGNQSSGQLLKPAAVAIDSHGNILVSDQSNRILKYAPSGNFLMAFGSTGNGTGQFNFARGLSVDSQDNIYVADGNNNRVQKFDSNGNYLVTISKPGIPNGYTRLPFDVKIDSNSNIFILDTGNTRVQKFSPNGSFLATFGKSGHTNGSFSGPWGITVNSNGFVYVSDTYNDRVQVFDNNYNFVRSFGSVGSAPGQFLNPSGIVVDNNGIIYVADYSNDRVESFYNNGTFLAQFKTRQSLMEPYFVFFDQAGHLLASDGHNHKVLGFNATTGILLSQFGGPGSGPGQMHGPRGIGIDAQGNRIIAEDYNNRISKFDANGNFLMSWGSTGSAPGQFNQPRGILVDSSGNIYVADTQNNRIQKFDSNTNYLASFSTTLPYQIAFDKQGNIYSADETAQYVEKLDSTGHSLMRIGSSGPGLLSNPKGVYVDQNGIIFVADSAKNVIEKFNQTGKFIKSFGSSGKGIGQFNNPRGILIDSSGNLWVDDTGNLRIQEFDSNFNFIKQISYSFGNNVPSITITSPAKDAMFSTNKINVTGTAFDFTSVFSVTWKVDNGSVSTATGTTNWSFATGTLSNGIHTISVNATDAAGQFTTQSITITVDTMSPIISITSPINGTTLNTNKVLLTGTASDSGTGLQQISISIDGGSFSQANGTTSWNFTMSSLSNGIHTVTAKALDNVGNYMNSSIIINVSTTNSVFITSVSNSLPRWNLDSVTISGNVTGASPTDTIAVSWGDGSSSTGISTSGSLWGPVSHTYGSAATSTNPNQIVVTLRDNTNAVKAASTPSLVNVQTHRTSLSLLSINSLPWGNPTSFTATLTDTDNGGTTISGEVIHFNGTGVIGVADKATNGTGKAMGTGTAPSTVTSGWTVQAHFTGDSLYSSSDSSIQKYNTIKHSSALFIALSQNNTPPGSSYKLSVMLKDGITGTGLGSRTISFTADSPIIINNIITDSTGKFTISSLVSPSTTGSYNILAKFAGDNLYNLSNSNKVILTVS